MLQLKLSKAAHATNNDFLDNLIIAGKRQSNVETKSYWNKFKTFCQLATLLHPDTWNLDDFTAGIFGKHSCWLMTEGKSGLSLVSYRLCIGGLITHLGEKNQNQSNEAF